MEPGNAAAPIVLVTGGAHRLGAALCRAYARRGHEVLCHYRESAAQAEVLVAQLRAEGCAAHAVWGDLSNMAAADTLFERALAITGRIDVLVNNASIFEPDSGLQLSPESLDRQLRINAQVPMALAARLARHCRDRGVRGAVAHILDQKVQNLNPDYASYTSSKLLLAAAVAQQAQNLAPHLRVIGIAPGLLALSGPQSSDNFEWAARQNLLRQPVAIDDVARATVDLSGNPSITGTIVNVDCGQHLVPTARDVMFLGPGGGA